MKNLYEKQIKCFEEANTFIENYFRDIEVAELENSLNHLKKERITEFYLDENAKEFIKLIEVEDIEVKFDRYKNEISGTVTIDFDINDYLNHEHPEEDVIDILMWKELHEIGEIRNVEIYSVSKNDEPEANYTLSKTSVFKVMQVFNVPSCAA